MSESGTLHDAFIDELRDTYDAEKQLTKALPKLAKAASNGKLRAAFESHLTETEGQITRLEKVFESLGEKVRGKHCDGIAGIIEEGKSVMEEDFDDTTMDACLIASGQRAEHYEMAAYGTLIAWAQAMNHNEAVKLLQQNLDEEKAADKKLSALAEGGINQSAADAAHADEEEELVGAGAGSGEKERGEERTPVTVGVVEGAMVLIQLLLPTTGTASAEGLAPLAATRRELAERFNGLTACLRSPAKRRSSVSGRGRRASFARFSRRASRRPSREIADACIQRGYQYAAVTDRAYGLKTARGMSMAEAAQQRSAIDRVNARHGKQFRLLQGIEANIDAAGQLDLTDDEAATFDVVLAAPHSVLRTNNDQTGRMLAAVRTRRSGFLPIRAVA